MQRLRNFIKNEGPVLFFLVLIFAQVGCKDSGSKASPMPPEMVGLWQDDATATEVKNADRSSDICNGFLVETDDDNSEYIDLGFMNMATDGSAFAYSEVKKQGALSTILSGHIDSNGTLTYAPELAKELETLDLPPGIALKSSTNLVTITEEDKLQLENTVILSFNGIDQDPQIDTSVAVRVTQEQIDEQVKLAQACLNK